MNKLYTATYVAIFVFFVIVIWLFNNLINIKKHDITQTLDLDLSGVERVIINDFTQSSAIINSINLQVADNVNDHKFINKILRIYKTHPSLIDTFSWTSFSWVNKKDMVVVDTLDGILQNPVDVSDRDYLQFAKSNPNQFYIGSPVVGSTSKKWIIPGGVALIDQDQNYLGSMIMGIAIDSFSKMIQKTISNKNVTVWLFGPRSTDPILVASPTKANGFRGPSTIINQNFLDLIKVANDSNDSVMDIEMLFNQHAYMVKKIHGFNYVLALEYNSKAINNELWFLIWSRSIELLSMIIITSALAIFIYRRENKQKKLIMGLKDVAETANNRKSVLLKTISHDLRNYIFGISGLANIISDYDKKTSPREVLRENSDYAKMISSQCKEMMEFVQDILDINHIHPEGLKLSKFEDCDLNNILNKIFILNKSFSAEHGVKLVPNVATNLPTLRCDKRRLKQILDNLIMNAIKYTPSGKEVKVTVKYLQQEKKILIEISDQGIGMSTEDIKNAISGNANKIDKSLLNKSYESYGIGLPTVKELVDLHGARMDIFSKKGQGTKFILLFDVK